MTTVKLTLKQIINGSAPLNRLGSEKFRGKNAGKITYALAKNIALTEPHVLAYQKAQTALFEKYQTKRKLTAEEKEKGVEPNWIVAEDVIKAFNEEVEELLADEIELDIRPIILPEPTDESPLLINAVDLFLLEWMIKIEGFE